MLSDQSQSGWNTFLALAAQVQTSTIEKKKRSKTVKNCSLGQQKWDS
jgi:hypothetical protein